MNRSLPSVIMGGVGSRSQGTGEAKKITGTHTEANADQVGRTHRRGLGGEGGGI